MLDTDHFPGGLSQVFASLVVILFRLSITDCLFLSKSI
jgi:hypothetical protein